jgi:SAM-dependent methyltransferase
MTTALDVYAASLRTDGDPLVLHYRDGRTRSLPVDVWTAVEVAGDTSLVDRCVGATLDIGCGPGRLVVAVAGRGLPVLGVDIAPGAVRLARARGALAITRSVFAELPGRGRWHTALLADGNVGIGGNPVVLLTRVRDLLAAGGTALVELDPPGTPSGPVHVRMEHAGELSPWFPWAHLATEHVEVVADAAGFTVTETWQEADRWFAALVRA